MSEIKPQLDAHGIGLAGIGLEKLGVEEFVSGGFFKGGIICNRNCFYTRNYLDFIETMPVVYAGFYKGVQPEDKTVK